MSTRRAAKPRKRIVSKCGEVLPGVTATLEGTRLILSMNEEALRVRNLFTVEDVSNFDRSTLFREFTQALGCTFDPESIRNHIR